MKNQHIRVRVFIFCLSFFVCVGVSSASFVWTAYGGEVEFGLTSQVGDSVVSDPWVFETGYSGAWLIGYDLFVGAGQTFKASNEGSLRSIELRVGDFDYGATGEFEVALYEVVLAKGEIADYTKIASVFRRAEDYRYDFGINVPVSSFDFSHFDIALSLAKTYAIAVLPTSSLDGRITVQAALDIYTEGNAWDITILADPVLTSITPISAEQGDSLSATITGQNTNFMQGSSTTVTSVWFSQGSSTINASSFWANSPTSASANFDIPGGASTGLWDVKVTDTIDGTLTLADGFTINVQGPTTWYVDDDAYSANNGSSWADAFNYLQDALAAAQSGDEIWIAQGTYMPDANTTHPDGTGDREATFQLKNGVAVRGGYAGYGETDPNVWDIELYETILSGDLSDNDGPNFANNSENSYHVVTSSGMDETTVLDGFTITGGNADGGSPPRCFGGGVFNESANPIVSNCTFCSNFSHNGGGMYNKSSNTMLTECIFSGNSAGDGGGMLNDESNLTLVNCIFSGNSATISAGGMYDSNSTTTLINCTFNNNSSISWGGGINGAFSEPTLINCILWDNTADRGSQISMKAGSIVSLSYCDVEGGQAAIYLSHFPNHSALNSTVDWGNGNIDDDPLFMDPNGADNILGTRDDNLRLLPDSPCIDTGNPNYIAEPNETDLDGKPRVTGGRIDMGAYEANYIQARLWLFPQVINRNSRMRRVMAWIHLPKEITKDQVDKDQPVLLYCPDAAEPIEPIRQYVFQHGRGRHKRTYVLVFYDKAELMTVVPDNGTVDLEVVGSLKSGQYFYGSDTVRIIGRRW